MTKEEEVEIKSRDQLKPRMILRDVRGTLWRVGGDRNSLVEIDPSGKRLKPGTYESFGNLSYFRGPLVQARLDAANG